MIEVDLDLGGYPVALADTAGLRDSDDPIEGEGIRRAKSKAACADLKLVLFDAASEPDASSLSLLDQRSVAVANKIDLAISGPNRRLPPGVVPISVSHRRRIGPAACPDRGAGARRIRPGGGGTGHYPGTPSRSAGDGLARIARAMDQRELELMAEDLRLAARALGRIGGHVDVEDLLDRFFGSSASASEPVFHVKHRLPLTCRPPLSNVPRHGRV